MLEAKTLHNSLLPLIYTSIPFGVAPRLPTSGKTLQFLTFIFSLAAVAFSVVTIVLLLMVTIKFINNDLLRWFLRDVPSPLTTWSSVIALTTSVGTHLPYRRINTFANITETLARIDDDLKFDRPRNHTKTKKILCTIVIGIILYHLTLIVWNYYSKYWSQMILVVPAITVKLILVQYIVLVALLKQRFALINRYLMKSFGFSDIPDEGLSLYGMSSVSIIRGMVSTKMVMHNKVRLLELLDMLQEKHSKLTGLIGDINALYAISNIAIVVETLVTFTWNVYTIIYIIFGGYTSLYYEFLITIVAGTFMRLTNIFVYAVVCDKASVVARRPVVLVETFKLHLGADQQILAERLDLFAQHIQNTEFKFTAYSLVTFDFSLLGTFAGTVTMYLIILLQFAVSNKFK